MHEFGVAVGGVGGNGDEVVGVLEEEGELEGVVFLAAGLGKVGGIVGDFHAVAVPAAALLAGFEEGEEQGLQSVAEEGVGFFLNGAKGTKLAMRKVYLVWGFMFLMEK